MKKYGAEFIGTFWLVLGGCGSAVLAAAFPGVGIGLLGVALAFGLTVLTMAYAGKRFPARQLLPYIVAQVAGAVLAGGVLYLIASGKAGFDVSAGFASNGYGAHSPGGYSLLAALVTEVVMTMMFLLIILGATDKRAPQGFAPIAIGLGLTLIHLRGPVCRRLGRRAAVALLACACRRCAAGRGHLSRDRIRRLNRGVFRARPGEVR
jgi:aquaporin Z